jgi:hypothetical protein
MKQSSHKDWEQQKQLKHNNYEMAINTFIEGHPDNDRDQSGHPLPRLVRRAQYILRYKIINI